MNALAILFVAIYFGVIIYLISLFSRLVGAVERIADKFDQR